MAPAPHPRSRARTAASVGAVALACAAVTTLGPATVATATGPSGSTRVVLAADHRSATLLDAHGRVKGGWRDLATDEPQLSYGRQEVGGGIWTYGSYDESGYKHCWSKYYNIYAYHSATAQMTASKTVYAYAFEYADAHITQKITSAPLCRVYWNVY